MLRKLTPLLVIALAAGSCGKRGSFVSRLSTVPQAPIPASATARIPEETLANDEPGAALKFFVQQRAPDGKEIPTDRYLEAAAETRRRTHKFSLATGKHSNVSAQADLGGGWKSLGPNNVGGLTRAFVIHPNKPNIMYAGASGGGVWKTTDAGATWKPLIDLLPSISVHWLTLDPKDPETIYAGTGDNIGATFLIRGAGIYKSSDSGATWNILPGTVNDPNFYIINRVVISPNDSSRIYAATTTGIWMSTDGGTNFNQTLPRVAPNSGCEDLVIRTDQSTDYLFAACGRFNSPSSAIYRNVDATNSGTWEIVMAPAGMGSTSLALAPSNQQIIYAMMTSVDPGNAPFSGGLLAVYRSRDNGDKDTWEVRASNTDTNRVIQTLLSNPRSGFADICSGGKASFTGQGVHDNVLAVDPLFPNRLWAGGIDLFRSDDGGLTWGIAMYWELAAPQGAHADNHVLVFHPQYDGDSNQTLYNTSDGGIYMTDNANADVVKGDRAACTPYGTKVVWKSLNNGYSVTQFYDGTAYPGANAYMAGAQDNGTKFGSDGLQGAWSSVFGGDGGFVLVNPTNPNIIYWDYVNLSLYRSKDGGNTGNLIIDGITEPPGNFLFIAPVAMDPSEPKRIYIGGKSLWRSNDTGDSWTQVSTLTASSQGSISAIANSPADPNVAMYGTSGGSIFYSTTALSNTDSTTWKNSSPRSSGYVARIAFDPKDPNVAYAVYRTYRLIGQNYIYKTGDGGAHWTPIDGSGSTAIPDGPVHSIAVDPVNPQTLYVGTEHGIFTSLDNGNSWLPDDNPFANVPVTQLVLDRTAGISTLVAFTYGRGVWKTVLPGSAPACTYSLASNTATVSPAGAITSLGIQTGDGCPWPMVPLASWLYAQSPAIGYGSGTAAFYGDFNASTTPRTGRILVGTALATVTQTGGSPASGHDTNSLPIASTPYLGFFDNRAFTSDAGDPVHSCTGSSDYKTAWWSFTPDTDGTLQLIGQGRRYDVFGGSGVVVSVYDTSRDAKAELGCAFVNRNTTAWSSTTPIEIPVTAGKTYQIELSATTVDGGLVILAALMK